MTRTTLRAVLRAIAAGVPLIGASCGCPKPWREVVATYDARRLPAGEYRLDACAGTGVVECRYVLDGPQTHAVIQVFPCDEVCGPATACAAEGAEAVCLGEAEARIAMPATLEDPAAFAGTCRGDAERPCEYHASRDRGGLAYLESLDGFGGDLEDRDSNDGCSLDPATGQVSCWHGHYLNCKAGRRPDGAVDHEGDASAQLVLEAASAPAFDALAAELRLHRAPAALVRGATRAITDELRHAAILGALGRVGPIEVRVERRDPRALREVALDNAREGCAGEALAAIAAQMTADRAHGPARAALASIARDEARHALLSFAIDDWARARLGARAARELDDAWRAALSARV